MAKINIELGDYANAKDGSLLIKKNGQWQVTTFEELNKANKQQFEKIDKCAEDLIGLKNNSKHFVPYAKSHFFVVFNYFKIKVLSGEIDAIDETVLHLDEKVLNDEILVEDAIAEHEFLQETFNKLYLSEKEMKNYPEV